MALTTVASVKTHLGISDTSQDTLLTQLVAQVDAAIKSYCTSPLEEATYTEFYSGSGTRELVLLHPPVQSITSLWLKSDGYFGDGSSAFGSSDLQVAGTDYVLQRDDNTATEKSKSGIVLRIGGVWPKPKARSADLIGAVPGHGLGNIKIVYVGGWDTVPSDLALAANLMVAQLFQSRTGDLQSESYEDYQYTRLSAADEAVALGSVKGLLRAYKRWVI